MVPAGLQFVSNTSRDRSVLARHLKPTNTSEPEAVRVGAPRSSALWWKIAARGTTLGMPRGILIVWPRWESVVRRIRRLAPVPGSRNRVLILRLAAYRGAPFTLPDGTPIKRGTRVCEMHCDNRVLARLALQGANPYRAARDDLRQLAAWMEETDPAGEIAGLYGVTIITKASQRLGFTIRELPHGLSARVNRWFMTGLLLIYTKGGMTRLSHGLTLRSWPCEVWLSRSSLRRLYGARANQGAVAWPEHSTVNLHSSPDAPAV
jgi:hypothetical protein